MGSASCAESTGVHCGQWVSSQFVPTWAGTEYSSIEATKNTIPKSSSNLLGGTYGAITYVYMLKKLQQINHFFSFLY